MQKRKEQVIYYLRATSWRQNGPIVYQITLKTYKMPQSYHSLKSENILKIFLLTQREKIKKKPGHRTSQSDNTWMVKCLDKIFI